MALVKVGPKHQVVIPKEVFIKLGLVPGDYVEVTYERKTAKIRPTKIVDKYTDEPIGPKTRAGIRQGLKDMAEGRLYGPFRSAKELLDHLHRKARESK